MRPRFPKTWGLATMAVNVLIIPEDFRKDQYVLKPFIETMFAAIDTKACVQVCCDPLLAGVGEALKWDRIEEILRRYKGMTRVFLLVVDRDCEPNRRAKLDGLETKAAEYLTESRATFLAVEAHQEIEVWVLAGLKPRPKGMVWKNVRSECHPKERYYDAVVRARGLTDAPYQGRRTLTREAVANYSRIRQLCPEDVGSLETRLRAVLEPPCL